MKILQITPFFFPSIGGIENYVYNLSTNLSNKEHKITILTVNTENVQKEEIISEKVSVYRCSLNFRYHKGLISIEFIKRILSANDYDIYHVHIPFPLGLEIAVVASKIHKIPLVVTHHGEYTKGNVFFSLISSIYSKICRNISLKYVDWILFLTSSYSVSLRLNKKIRKKIKIIKTGVDIQRFSAINDGAILRKKYGFTANDKIVLFVGSLSIYNRYKGVDYLIRALHEIRSVNNSVKLLIVGEGKLVSELKELAKELKLEKEVIFATSVSDEELPYCYAMCDVFALPSISGPESFGIVLLEAMASGKPVIASGLPGVNDVVKDGITGYLVEPKNVKQLSQRILKIIKDVKLGKKFGRNSQRVIIEEYQWANIVEEFEELYNNAMCKNGDGGT